MKKRLLSLSILFLGAAVLLSSCKKDRDEDNDEEVITTMQLTFMPVSGGGNPLIFQFDDPDGPGGNNPTKDEIVLSANTMYNVSVRLLNKTVNPAADITAEVAAEAASHRFYYQPSAGSNISVTNFNTDIAGIPLGITSTWSTGAPATGTVKVILRHYPGNPPNKAADDPVTSSKSSTDVEVEFNTRVL